MKEGRCSFHTHPIPSPGISSFPGLTSNTGVLQLALPSETHSLPKMNTTPIPLSLCFQGKVREIILKRWMLCWFQLEVSSPAMMEDYCVTLSQTHHIQRNTEQEMEITLVYSMGFCKNCDVTAEHMHFGGWLGLAVCWHQSCFTVHTGFPQCD